MPIEKEIRLAIFALICALFLPGCMTSRGICTVTAPGEIRRPTVTGRYRITQIQQRLPGGNVVNVHSNRRMCQMLNDALDVKEMESYTPGVWSVDGIPVTITFCDWQTSGEMDWTAIPCVLTLGICPYFHHEDIVSRVEVSRDDGKGMASFGYHESEDWKISLLFPLGWVPYMETVLARNEFQLCGRGDVLAKPHFDGLAHGIASALAEMEAQTQNTKR